MVVWVWELDRWENSSGSEIFHSFMHCVSKTIECITHKVKSERNKKLSSRSSPASVYLYPGTPPSLSVIVNDFMKLPVKGEPPHFLSSPRNSTETDVC